jgi:anti-anti-sigma factor
LSGELDLATAPLLEERLTQLLANGLRVSLDLSGIEFIDSSGIHVLIRTVEQARVRHWEFRIDNEIPAQLLSMLRLLRLDRFLLSGGTDAPPTGRGRSQPASYEAPSAA